MDLRVLEYFLTVAEEESISHSQKSCMGHKNEDMSLNSYASASDEDAFKAMMNKKY